MPQRRTHPSPFEFDRFSPGLGTYSLTGVDGIEAMTRALETGYRHIDTARLYGNEREVGEALQRADVDREDILVATKVAHFEEHEKTPEYVRMAVSESINRLGISTLDVVYHHWPRDVSDVETVLPVLAEFVERGVVDNIAVSNYPIRYLELIDDIIDIPIAAHQIEMHPLLQQEELYEYLRNRDIPLVAYSPLAQGMVSDITALNDVAAKHESNPYSVSLAWLEQKDDVVPIPRSSSIAHIEQNYTARSLELDEKDIEKIESIEQTDRLEDPEWMAW